MLEPGDVAQWHHTFTVNAKWFLSKDLGQKVLKIFHLLSERGLKSSTAPAERCTCEPAPYCMSTQPCHGKVFAHLKFCFREKNCSQWRKVEKFDKRDIIATISNTHQLRHSTNPCMQWKNIDLLHNKRSMQTKQEFKWGDRSGTATKQDIQAQRQQIIQAKSIISATRTRVIIRLRLDCGEASSARNRPQEATLARSSGWRKYLTQRNAARFLRKHSFRKDQ